MKLLLLTIVLLLLLGASIRTQTLSGKVTLSGNTTSGTSAGGIPGLANNGSRYTPLNYTTFTPPAKGGSFVDSRFGTTIRRMSDGQTDFGGSGCVHHDLHSTNVTNWQENYTLLLDCAGDYFVIQTSDSTVVRDRAATAINNNEEAKWAGKTNEIFYTQVGTNVLKKYNVDTNTRSTVKTFSSYSDISLGQGEGDVSEDGDHLVITADQRYVFVYKLSTDEIGPVLDTGQITIATITNVSSNTITIGTYQNGYTWDSFQTSGGRSKFLVFLAGTPNTVRGTATITSKPTTDQLTASGGLPAGTAIGDKIGVLIGFDQAHVTPNNRVLVGYYQPNASGNTGYDAVGTQIYTKSMVRVTLNPAIQALFHCDVGRDSDGSEVMIQEADSDYTPATGSGGGIQKQNLNTGTKTALLNMGYFTSKHPSIPSAGTFPWVVADPVDSDFSDADSPINRGRTATLPGISGLASDWDSINNDRWRYDNINELSLLKLDGSEVRHLAHHRSRLDVGLYWATSRPTFSQRGTWVIFDSNFATQPVFDFTDVFAIRIKADTTDWTDPVISSISSGTPGSTTATITWSTNEGATSQVEWGTTTFYGGGISTFDTSLVTSHSVNLTGLSPSTTYHYRVKSRDQAGNITLSSDGTFTTSA